MSARRGSEARSNGDRREQVLTAARELFFERGYRGTTMAQIASRAGYSKRTTYLDYRNKDELFISVCAEGGELLLSTLEDVSTEGLAVEEGIDRYLDIYIRFSRNHRGYFRMIFNESTPDIISNCSDEVRARVAELERACLGVIAEWIESALRKEQLENIDPWEAAGVIIGSATGIILLSLAGSQSVFSQRSLESLARRAVRAFWAGIRMSGDLDETVSREEA